MLWCAWTLVSGTVFFKRAKTHSNLIQTYSAITDKAFRRVVSMVWRWTDFSEKFLKVQIHTSLRTSAPISSKHSWEEFRVCGALTLCARTNWQFLKASLYLGTIQRRKVWLFIFEADYPDRNFVDYQLRGTIPVKGESLNQNAGGFGAAFGKLVRQLVMEVRFKLMLI